MMKRFGWWILSVAVVGLVMALIADTSSGNRDALREVGGAIVSGAVLAGLVVWFEDRREDERDNRTERREQTRHDREQEREDERHTRAEEREDVAAQAAWRREIDLRLLTVVKLDLPPARDEWLDDLEGETREGDILLGAVNPHRKPFWDQVREASSLLAMLRVDALTNAWGEWHHVASAHEVDVRPPTPTPPPTPPKPRNSIEALQGMQPPKLHNYTLPSLSRAPTRDADDHVESAAVEDERWNELLAQVDAYMAARYPR